MDSQRFYRYYYIDSYFFFDSIDVCSDHRWSNVLDLSFCHHLFWRMPSGFVLRRWGFLYLSTMLNDICNISTDVYRRSVTRHKYKRKRQISAYNYVVAVFKLKMIYCKRLAGNDRLGLQTHFIFIFGPLTCIKTKYKKLRCMLSIEYRRTSLTCNW